MTAYEYKVVVAAAHDTATDDGVAMLDQYGRDGWELVSVRARNTGGFVGAIEDVFYFKRRVGNDRDT